MNPTRITTFYNSVARSVASSNPQRFLPRMSSESFPPFKEIQRRESLTLLADCENLLTSEPPRTWERENFAIQIFTGS